LGPVPAAFGIKVSVNVPSSWVVAGALSDTPTLVFWVGTGVAARPAKLIDGVTMNDAGTDVVLLLKLLSPL
jgi:hypothetical protein